MADILSQSSVESVTLAAVVELLAEDDHLDHFVLSCTSYLERLLNQHRRRLHHDYTVLCAGLESDQSRKIRLPRNHLRPLHSIANISDVDFKLHFRMQRRTFEALVKQVSGVYRKNHSNPHIPIDHQLLMTLWVLANNESYQDVAERFNTNRGLLHFVFMQMCQHIATLAPSYIAWPDQAECSRIAQAFEEQYRLPNAVGVLGNCHVAIKGHGTGADCYYNKHGFCSMVLQAVCNHAGKFIDVAAGYPGCLGNDQIFQISELCVRLRDGASLDKKYHVLADTTYRLEECVMTPYRDDGTLTKQQKTYNCLHGKAISLVQEAFCSLKAQFTRLQCLDMARMDLIPVVILAACTLFNIVLMAEELHEQTELFSSVGVVHSEVTESDDSVAAMKRNEIASQIS